MGGIEWETALDINRALLRPIFLSVRKKKKFLKTSFKMTTYSLIIY